MYTSAENLISQLPAGNRFGFVVHGKYSHISTIAPLSMMGPLADFL